MPDYLLSGTNGKGRRVVERVAADTANEALTIMRQRGYSSVELHTDDVTAAMEVTGEPFDGIRKHVRPEMELRLRRSSDAGAMLLAVADSYRRLWFYLLLAIGILVVRRTLGLAWHWVDYAALCAALLLLVAPPIVTLLAPRYSPTYTRLQQAAVAARWGDVLRLAVELERSLAKLGPGVATDLVFWRAKALAALGHLDEGLAVAANVPARRHLSEGAYLTQLATVYDAANDADGALECFQKATRASPDEPAGWLGLAEFLAVRFERPQDARAALERLLEFPLTDQTRSGIQFIEGAIALAEGRFAPASESLEAFRTHMVKVARAAPLAIGHQRLSEALLAIAHARKGDRQTALSYYRAAVPFLRLHRADHLLRRCQAALPEAAEPQTM